MAHHYDDFRRISCDTEIREIRDGWYLFEDTVFYGEKGGMPSDTGTVNGMPVTALKWDGDDLLHRVDGELNGPVHMEIDWPVRLLNTVVQTGLHCMDGFYEQAGQHIIAFSVNPENQWYETDGPAQDLNAVQAHIDRIIDEDHPVHFRYMNGADWPDPAYHRFEDLRLVEIEGVNTQPCGTLHVNSTGEIGSFVILGDEHTSRGTKVFFTCGPVTEMRLKNYHRIMEEVGRSLSAKGEEMIGTAAHLQELNRSMKKEIDSLKKELAGLKAEALKNDPASVIEVSAGDVNELRNIGTRIMKSVNGTKILYSPHEGETYFAVISAENRARDILEEMKKRFNVAGGGSPKLATAAVYADRDVFLKALEEIL